MASGHTVEVRMKHYDTTHSGFKAFEAREIIERGKQLIQFKINLTTFTTFLVAGLATLETVFLPSSYALSLYFQQV